MHAYARVIATLRRLLLAEDGPTATEYGILIGLIVLGAMSAIRAVGTRMSDIYDVINAAVDPVIGSGI
jgi:Flp pilus assembly pilin Flp